MRLLPKNESIVVTIVDSIMSSLMIVDMGYHIICQIQIFLTIYVFILRELNMNMNFENVRHEMHIFRMKVIGWEQKQSKSFRPLC